MTEAARHNEGKPRLSQLHHFELAGLAAHCDRGRVKYPDTEDGRPNWTLGGKPKEEYLDAIERHVERIVKYGEVYDAETGTRHVDAIAWNALAAGTVATDYVGLPLTRETLVHDEPVPLDTNPEVRVTFEGEEGVLKVAYPEPGINTFYADGGRKVPLYPEQLERAEAEQVLVYL